MSAAVTAAQMRAVIRAGLRRDVGVDGGSPARGRATPTTWPTRAAPRPWSCSSTRTRATVTYATAGHAPPLLLPAHGPVKAAVRHRRRLARHRHRHRVRARVTCPLAPGDVVLLASAAAQRSAPLVLSASSDGGAAAPSTILSGSSTPSCPAWRPTTPSPWWPRRLRESVPRELRTRLQRDAGPVRQAREELGTWLAELRASPMDQMSVTHATAELVTNAVEHGGSQDDGQIEVHARLGSDGVVRVEVLDHGTLAGAVRGPRARPRPGDGRRPRRPPGGLHRPVRHPGPPAAPAVAAGVDRRLSTGRTVRLGVTAPVQVEHTGSAPWSRCAGDFGHDDVERVAAEILVASRGGTIGLSLDLTEVSEISTSAVRLLVDLTSVNRAVGMFTADIDIPSSAAARPPSEPSTSRASPTVPSERGLPPRCAARPGPGRARRRRPAPWHCWVRRLPRSTWSASPTSAPTPAGSRCSCTTRSGTASRTSDPCTARPPAPCSIAYSWSARPDIVDEARRDGACGFLSKELTTRRSPPRSGRSGPGHRGRFLVQPFVPAPRRESRPLGLTEREQDVLELVTRGSPTTRSPDASS